MAKKPKLIKKAKEEFYSQSYGGSKEIEGVKVVELKRFTGADGSFNEVVRLKAGKLAEPKEVRGFEVKQINHSKLVAGGTKAWHFHLTQDEIWFIPGEGKAIVGLLDLREGSPSKEVSMRLSLGDGRAFLIYIPRGVAHGISNPYLSDLTMTYLVNNHFNGKDEQRIDYGFLVGSDFWEMEKD